MSKTKKQLELELLELKRLLDKQNTLLANEPSKEQNDYNNDIEIKMTRMVRVVSLYHGVLNLKTSNQVDATIFTFNFFGYEQPIFYSDLIKCINTQRRLFTDGFCYIKDEEVIKTHYLNKIYEHLLDKDAISNYTQFDEDFIKNNFGKLPAQQKITVLETIAFKLNENENIDRNKIDILAKLANVDIYELAKKLQ